MEPRKRATQSASKIIAAVTQLLDERDANTITITDVVQIAGVTRPTFYSAFGDLPTAFAEAAGQRLIDDMGVISISDMPEDEVYDTVSNGLHVIMTRIARHNEFYSRALHGHAGRIVQTRVIRVLEDEIRRNVPISKALQKGPMDYESALTAIAASVSWTMLEWFTESPQTSIEQLTAKLRDILYFSVYGGLGKAARRSSKKKVQPEEAGSAPA